MKLALAPPPRPLPVELPPPFRFRAAAPQDKEFLFGLYAATRVEELATVPWTAEQKAVFLRIQFNAQDSQYKLHYPGGEFLILQVENIDAGRLYLHCLPREIRLIDLSLLPEQRGRGVGGQILRDLIDEAGLTRRVISLNIEKRNPSLKFFRTLGFQVVQEAGIYWHMMWNG